MTREYKMSKEEADASVEDMGKFVDFIESEQEEVKTMQKEKCQLDKCSSKEQDSIFSSQDSLPSQRTKKFNAGVEFGIIKGEKQTLEEVRNWFLDWLINFSVPYLSRFKSDFKKKFGLQEDKK